jgi:hypothetical protein
MAKVFQVSSCGPMRTRTSAGTSETYAVQQNASLFDHLVRELLGRQRHLKAKRLGGLQIDIDAGHHLEQLARNVAPGAGAY